MFKTEKQRQRIESNYLNFKTTAGFNKMGLESTNFDFAFTAKSILEK